MIIKSAPDSPRVQITEQVAALGKSQFEAALKIAEVAGSNLEKLAELQLSDVTIRAPGDAAVGATGHLAVVGATGG